MKQEEIFQVVVANIVYMNGIIDIDSVGKTEGKIGYFCIETAGIQRTVDWNKILQFCVYCASFPWSRRSFG